jgi:hypothetical protein
MDADLLQIFIQFPLLGIFVWYNYQQNKRWDDNNKQWRQYLTERNDKLEKHLVKVNDTLEKFHDNLLHK